MSDRRCLATVYQAWADGADSPGERIRALAAAVWLEPENVQANKRLLSLMAESGDEGLLMEWSRRSLGWNQRVLKGAARTVHDGLCMKYGWTRPPSSGPSKTVTNRGGQGVVFLSDRPMSREWKLARYLRAQGLRVHLLHPSGIGSPYETSDAFASISVFDDESCLRRELKRLNPGLIHAFVYKSYRMFVDLLVDGVYPIALDPYDVLNDMFTVDRMMALGQFGDVQLEKFCLEMSHGLICRDTRLGALRRQYPLLYPDHVLYFADYADRPSDQIQPRKQRLDDGLIHFVYAGPVAKMGGADNRDDRNYRDLLDMAERHGGKIHLFLSKNSGRGMSPDLPRRSSVELHEPVPVERWIDAISPFDVMILYHMGYSQGWSSSTWTRRALDHSLSNRLFDCVDADLRLFCSRHHGAARMARRWGIDVPQSLEDLRHPEGWAALRARLERADNPFAALRGSLSGAAQAERLVRFYERVLETAQPQGAGSRIRDDAPSASPALGLSSRPAPPAIHAPGHPQRDTPRHRAVIHIGLHKAASTFIQRAAKACPRVGYVDFRQVEGLRRRAYDSALGRPVAGDGLAEDIQAFQGREGGQSNRLFLTDERLHIWRGPRMIAPDRDAGRQYQVLVRDGLKALCPQARIVLVTRAPDAWLTSMYRQDVKVGSPMTFAEWQDANHEFLTQAFAVDALIALYARAFGAENILVLPYELLRDDPLRFSALFDDFTNLDLRLHEAEVRRNTGLPRALTESIRAVNATMDTMARRAGMDQEEYYQVKRSLFRFLDRAVADEPENTRWLAELLGGEEPDLQADPILLSGLRLNIRRTIRSPLFEPYQGEYVGS